MGQSKEIAPRANSHERQSHGELARVLAHVLLQMALARLPGSPAGGRMADQSSAPPTLFPFPKWTSFPAPPDPVHSVLHVLSSFFHEGNEGNEITGLEGVQDELLGYLSHLGFFENEAGDGNLPFEFVDTYGLGPILAGLKFSLYQRNIGNPGGFLRRLIEGDDMGLHPFVRKRLLGYVTRFERWLCPEEAVLLRRWATSEERRPTGDAPRAEAVENAKSSPPTRRLLRSTRNSPTGCDCHDTCNEAYFLDHFGSSNGAALSEAAGKLGETT